MRPAPGWPIDALTALLAHLDSFSTVGTATAAALPSVGDSPAPWGRLVSGSAQHGIGVYLRDFGHGNLVVTMVTWA